MTTLNDLLGKKIDEVICNYNALLKFALDNENIQNTGRSIEKKEFETRDIFIFKYHLNFYNSSKSKFLLVDNLFTLEHQGLIFLRVLGVSFEDVDILFEERNVYYLPCESPNGMLIVVGHKLFTESFEKLNKIPHESIVTWENYDHSFIEDELKLIEKSNIVNIQEEEIWDDDYPPKSIFN